MKSPSMNAALMQVLIKGTEATAKRAEQMVFDWNQAARLIVELKPVAVYAGLAGDWDATNDIIYHNGKPIIEEFHYAHLSSDWAVPSIDIDDVIYECYVMKSNAGDWDANTWWPNSALEIIKNAAS